MLCIQKVPRALALKVLADVVESVIGAYFLHSTDIGARIVLSYFDIPMSGNDALLLTRLPTLNYPLEISKFPTMRCPNPTICASPTIDDITLSNSETKRFVSQHIPKIEDIFGYLFKYPLLVLTAYTHPSAAIPLGIQNYQRLEFIGDAVLDLLITFMLIRSRITDPPGELTFARSLLVCNATLGRNAKLHALSQFLLHASKTIPSQILEWSQRDDLKSNESLTVDSSRWKEQIKNFQYKKSSNSLPQIPSTIPVGQSEPPKVLGDIVESTLGAIYIDSGRSLTAVWRSMAKIGVITKVMIN
jgi:endoribonuclease Dicer